MPTHLPESEIDLDFLRACLREAGAIAFTQRGQMTAEMKPDHTPVTVVDRQVEDFLIGRITSRYPGHQILSEESGAHPGAGECGERTAGGGKTAGGERTAGDSNTDGGTEIPATYAWIIDPIDGTRSFASGLPVWGVSIGILRENQPYAGGLFLPVTGEMYWGTRRQAFYNDHPIPPLQGVDIDNPLVFLAVPSNFHLHFTITYPRVRSLGSTAAHLAYVLTGAAVGALTRKISLWDMAGILPLMVAVGIEITTLRGQPLRAADMLDGQKSRDPLLAAHPSVMERLRDSILH